MAGTVWGLLVIHRKQRDKRRKERTEAWNEQRELRRTLMTLHRVTGPASMKRDSSGSSEGRAAVGSGGSY
jgi:hypothetical protein